VLAVRHNSNDLEGVGTPVLFIAAKAERAWKCGSPPHGPSAPYNRDCVVVYKVDRLSRSLLDFARLVDRFDQRAVSFVSVTQQFNTTSSLGRLTLNILLSFAQFEREIIGERTRDKMSAARRKGKWVGGTPVLGYDVDPAGGRGFGIPRSNRECHGLTVVPGAPRMVSGEIWTLPDEALGAEDLRVSFRVADLRTECQPITSGGLAGGGL
jgi:hypothetical protein